jgi:hypothetical protein
MRKPWVICNPNLYYPLDLVSLLPQFYIGFFCLITLEEQMNLCALLELCQFHIELFLIELITLWLLWGNKLKALIKMSWYRRFRLVRSLIRNSVYLFFQTSSYKYKNRSFKKQFRNLNFYSLPKSIRYILLRRLNFLYLVLTVLVFLLYSIL